MSPETFLAVAIEPALAVLPEHMGGNDAKRFLLAICLQESLLKYRRQIKGPARGFPMFETGGVQGVLTHRLSKPYAQEVLRTLEYEDLVGNVPELQGCFEHNDVLALVFARLLIYTLPSKLPSTAAEGWAQYTSAWRPGKPHPETWGGAWELASLTVGAKA